LSYLGKFLSKLFYRLSRPFNSIKYFSIKYNAGIPIRKYEK